MRRTCPTLRGKGGWSTLKFKGDPVRRLNEKRRNRELLRDDIFRAQTGLPVWMNNTKRQIQAFREEDGDVPLIEVHKIHEHLTPQEAEYKENRREPLQFYDMDSWVSESICRTLIRQGITSFTEIQEKLLRALLHGHDICATSYTGSGKTFGIALILAERIVSRADFLPYSFVALAPSHAVCLQIQKWVSLLCATNYTYAIDPMVSEQEHSAALQARNPILLISTPEALNAQLAYDKRVLNERLTMGSSLLKESGYRDIELHTRRKRDNSYNKWKNTEREDTLLTKLRDNSQMIAVDEADSVFPTDSRDKRYYMSRDLIRSFLRIKGGQTGHHPSPQQQMIFISATLSYDSLSTFIPMTQTSEVKTDQGAPRLSYFTIKPKSELAQNDGRDGVKSNEPILVRPFSDALSVTESAIEGNISKGVFPPSLLHSFVVADSTAQMVNTIRVAVASYTSNGFSVPGLNVVPGRKQRETLPLSRHEARFLVVCSPEDVNAMVTCVNDATGFTCTAFVGGEKSLTDARNLLESGSVNALVVPNDSVRGLDFKSVTHIFIVGMPDTSQSYTHIAGRVARNGDPGMCVTLLNPRSVSKLRKSLKGTIQVITTKYSTLRDRCQNLVVEGKPFTFDEVEQRLA